MTSKEALEELRCVLVSSQDTKRYSDIFEENLLQPIEKDLEILDILKKHYDNNSLALSLNSFIVFTIHKDDKDFNKIKEWLEN